MKLVPNGVGRKVGAFTLKTKANSPHLFFGAGLIGVIGSTVLACRATLRLNDKLSEIQTDMDHAKLADDSGKETAKVYVRSGAKLVRLYGPALIVGTASVAALTGSHVQLSRRNATLMAAYTALHQAFEEYRARVAEEITPEKELDVRLNATQDKKLGRLADGTGLSPYARIFDESNMNWERDQEINRMFLECQARYANHLLKARGHVFLNDVYDVLGFERTSTGAVVGWLWQGEGDDYISFGMYEARNVRFINGQERSVILDFNVDGLIYDRI